MSDTEASDATVRAEVLQNQLEAVKEANRSAIESLERRLEDAQARVDDQRTNAQRVQAELDDALDQLAELRDTEGGVVDRLQRDHEERMRSLATEFRTRLDDQRSEYERTIAEMHDAEIGRQQQLALEIAALRADFRTSIEDRDALIAKLRGHS